MLRSLKNLRGYAVAALDGDLGWIEDFYFDEQDWVIRYVVLDTGALFPRRSVLITLGVVGRADATSQRVPVNLTREQAINSPEVDTTGPVSSQAHLELTRYFAFPPYWGAPDLAGAAGPVTSLPPDATIQAQTRPQKAHVLEAAPTLQSVARVSGCHVEAVDGPIGHVEDFISNDETWAIQQLVIDTRNWFPAKKVLISTEWVRQISWDESKVYVDRERALIQASPEYDPAAPVNEVIETRRYDYYGRPRT